MFRRCKQKLFRVKHKTTTIIFKALPHLSLANATKSNHSGENKSLIFHLTVLSFKIILFILYFPIAHNSLYLLPPPPPPPQVCINYCWEMFLGGLHCFMSISIVGRAFHNNSLCNIWEANRVNYGQLENRE